MQRMLLTSLTAVALLLGSPGQPSVRAPGSPRSIRSAAREQRRADVLRANFTHSSALQQSYRNKRFGFDIRYPRGWEVQNTMRQEEGTLITVVFFLSPFDEKTDEARENINLVVEDLSSPSITLEEYSRAAMDNVESLFSGFILSASHELLLPGSMRAHRVKYEGSMQGNTTVAFEQIWFLHEGQAYVWTLAATPVTFDAHSAIYRQMLGTLSFWE